MVRRRRSDPVTNEAPAEVKVTEIKEEVKEEPVKEEKPKRQAKKKEEGISEPDTKNLAVAQEQPEDSYDKFKGDFIVTAAYALRMRSGAGADKSIMTEITHGAKVKCDGRFTNVNGVAWLYVTYTSANDTTYKGYCLGTYLKKI